MARTQCPKGFFSAIGAKSIYECIACSAGKYLTDASGGVEALSCTNVSVVIVIIVFITLQNQSAPSQMTIGVLSLACQNGW
jgi:hypothetical protein